MRPTVLWAGWCAGLVSLACIVLPVHAATVRLEWTASGDDGRVGQAWIYELRWATFPITPANVRSAKIVEGLERPRPSGTTESFTVENLPDGVALYFAMRVVDDSGNWSPLSNLVSIPASSVSAAAPRPSVVIGEPTPNPAVHAVAFSILLPERQHVRAQVLDITGRHVKTLSDEFREEGRTDITWDLQSGSGGRVRPGVYLLRAAVGSRMWHRRVTVVR